MIRDKKVIVFTPWGRELTGSILFKYLERDHNAGVVDEWHLWLNTDPDQESDYLYGTQLELDHDWIKTFDRPLAFPVLYPKQMNTGHFYTFAQDEDAIYVRMDDDIVWIEENAIRRLVEQRIDNPFPFVVFPIIINNAVCSHWLQQTGRLTKDWGEVGMYCMDPIGWGNASFGELLHNHLLDLIEKDKVDELFMHHSIQLPVGLQFSVSSFAQFGQEYKNFNGVLGGEEESWHTVQQPAIQSRPNLIVPNSLISHFSFYTQRDYFLHNTDLLQRYKELADVST